MPELPEVEALAAYLRERAVGHRVERVDVAAISALKTYDPPVTALAGRLLAGAARHGKFLDLEFQPPGALLGKPLGAMPGEAPGEAPGDPSGAAPSDPSGAAPGAMGAGATSGEALGAAGAGGAHGGALHLVVHLARAGWLHYRDALAPAPPRPGKGPIALRVRLDDGSGFDLTEAGTQKSLAVYLVAEPSQVPGIARLGPDVLSLDAAAFAERLRARRGQVKGVLTDQEVIAGVGNAYSDEILNVARLSPFAITTRLTDEQLGRLHAATGEVLRDAVRRSVGQRAATLKAEKRSGLRVHARAGLPCPTCGDTVREVSFADSSLQYCPGCQTGGKPLADRRLSRLVK